MDNKNFIYDNVLELIDRVNKLNFDYDMDLVKNKIDDISI